MSSTLHFKPKNLAFLLLLLPTLFFCYLYFASEESPRPLISETSQVSQVSDFQQISKEPHSNRVYCDPNNRPKEEDCEKVPNSSTCGYYTDDCPLGVCGITDENGCWSCSDLSVLYYEPGECKPEIIVDSCYEDKCLGNADAWKSFEPICGWKDNCNEEICTRTFNNLCELCMEEDFRLFQYGVCEGDKRFCNTQDTTGNCDPGDNKPVCAFFTTDDDLFGFTTVRSCHLACLDSAVEYYLPRECGPAADNNVFCLPNVRPDEEECSKEVYPVCGFYGGEGQLDSKTFINSCHACADPDISFYWNESCD